MKKEEMKQRIKEKASNFLNLFIRYYRPDEHLPLVGWKTIAVEKTEAITEAKKILDMLELLKIKAGVDTRWALKAIVWWLEFFKKEADKLTKDFKIVASMQKAIKLDTETMRTSELTFWLRLNDEHIRYLTQALDEGGIDDGWKLLVCAYQKALYEVGDSVCELLTGLTSREVDEKIATLYKEEVDKEEEEG